MVDAAKRTEAAGILVRDVRPEEREAVAALLLELNRVEDALSGDRDLSPDAGWVRLRELESRMASTGGAILVALRDQRVIGTLVLLFELSEVFVRPELRGHGRIVDLAVSNGERGQGVGQRLIAEAENLTRAAGLSTMVVGALATNEPALGLYEKSGYRPQAIEFSKRV